MWTKIIRKGKDIGYLFRNRNYDFNYQSNFVLNPFVNITTDDELVTRCEFNTASREKNWTWAGEGTKNEVSKSIL